MIHSHDEAQKCAVRNTDCPMPHSLAARLGRTLRTVRHLQAGQIYWRLRYRLPTREPAWDAPRRRRAHALKFVAPVSRPPGIDASGSTATYMNETRSISTAPDWNDPEASKLWLYHLHYFDDLGAIAHRHGASSAHALVCRWIEENPPASGNGWEPYPASRRIVSWVKAALTGLELDGRAIHSVARQLRRVESRLERHLRANHLFMNAKALVFGGAFLDGSEADRILEKGATLLIEELREQQLRDGGHFERTVMYHAAFTEDLLDVLNLTRAFPDLHPLARIKPVVASAAVHAMAWLEVMTCPDGSYPRFNDCTGSEAPDFRQLRDYADRLAVPWSSRDSISSTLFEDSGFAALVAGDWTVYADVGSVNPTYQPGHAHAGTLSVEVYDGEQCIISGPGVSTYEIGPQRMYERSSRSRWAASIDGVDSSEVWAGFRVGRRATVFDRRLSLERLPEESVRLEASHDGFAHLVGGPTHKRLVDLTSERLVVHDSIIGSGKHRLTFSIPLAPGVALVDANDGRVAIRCPRGNLYELKIEPALRARIETGTLAPEFGILKERLVLTIEVEPALPFSLQTTIRRIQSRLVPVSGWS